MGCCQPSVPGWLAYVALAMVEVDPRVVGLARTGLANLRTRTAFNFPSIPKAGIMQARFSRRRELLTLFLTFYRSPQVLGAS
jgi:hypothetical protein